MKKKASAIKLAKALNIPDARGTEAIMKAQLITAILKAAEEQELTHSEIAKKAKLPRSAVTGILSGSLQKVTIDRILRIIEATGLTVHLIIKKAS